MCAYYNMSSKLYENLPHLKREDVEILQNWLKKQPHLPQIDEILLATFLHSCYYKLELTKRTIEYYFTKKTHFPHLFSSVDEEELKNVLSSKCVYMLPHKTPEGYAIIMIKIFDCKPENFNFDAAMRVLLMVCAFYGARRPGLAGAVCLCDMKGLALGHFLRINPMNVKHVVDIVQSGLPVRLKAIHNVNIVPLLDKLLGTVKGFMRPEIYDLIQIHSTFDSLYQHVPKECLPEEYGGTLPTNKVLQEEHLKTLLQNYDFFKWHDSCIVDETKRVGKVDNAAFGEEGTFRRLELD